MGRKPLIDARRRGKVFISYRRQGGALMARLVYDSLRQRGYRVFMDVEDLKSGPFNTALFDEIDSATDVVVVLGLGSLDRCHEENDWLRLEVAYAIKKNKNVIPVMMRGFQWPSEPLPNDIAALPNYQGLEPSHVLFKESMGRLAALLHSRPQPRRPWIKATIVAVCVTLVGITALCLSLDIFHLNRAAHPPSKSPVDSRDEISRPETVFDIIPQRDVDSGEQ